MIPRKLLETAFRLWWLIPVPILLVPLLVVSGTRQADSYQSSASIWVTKPDGVDPGALARNWSLYATPAQNQSAVMRDLFSTRTFREDIAARAGLVAADAPELARGLAGREAAASLSFVPTGTNVLSIRAHSPSPERAQALVAATIAAYQERAAVEVDRELEILRAYYSDQLTVATGTLTTREGDLAAYVQSNPEAISAQPKDPEYDRLSQEVARQQRLVDELNASVQDVDLRDASALQGQQAVFNVADDPSLPRTPQPEGVMTRLGYPAAGAAFGLVIVIFVVYGAYRADQSIRSAEDLEGTSLPLLGHVPEVRPGLSGRLRRRGAYARGVASGIGIQQSPGSGG